MDFSKLENAKPVKKQASSIKKQVVNKEQPVITVRGLFYNSIFQTCIKCDKSTVHIYVNDKHQCSNCRTIHEIKESTFEKDIIKLIKKDAWLLLF
jgi:hypothetical protein